MTELSESQFERIFEVARELSALEYAERRARLESLRAAGEDPKVLFYAEVKTGLSPIADDVVSSRLPDSLELGDRIGFGAMGTVYQARDAKSRDVAVKVIHEELIDAETIALFKNEIEALSLLHHTNIPTIHESCCSAENRQAFLVMDLVPGATITAWARDKRLNVEDRMGLFCLVCDAVAHAHGRGVLHLDLKPGNVIVNGGCPFVVDFGLARIFHPLCPRHDGWLVSGTPEYMSPEQVTIEFGQVTAKSDQYSLGLMLFELIVGCLPYRVERHSLEHVRSTILNPRIPTLDGAWGDLGKIVARALRRDPEDRYASVEDLQSAIRRWLNQADSSVLARVPPPHSELPAVEIECPFRGLEPFDVEHARYFFGRDREVADLLQRVEACLDDAVRLLAIVGTSGSGKSSLARAGLIAAVRQGKLPASEDWPIAVVRPGAEPCESLAVAITKEVTGQRDVRNVRNLMLELQTAPEMLHLTVRMALHGAPDSTYALILVDQLEEVFTLCENEEQRHAFIAALIHAASARNGRVIVATTLRNDFYGDFSDSRELAQLLPTHHVVVSPIGARDLHKVIEEPTRLAGLEIEPALVQLLLDDMREQANSLPLLQFALSQLWASRPTHVLTCKSYLEIGRLGGALTRHADATVAGFDAEAKVACRHILTRLVEPAGTGRDSKRRVPISEFGDSPIARAVLERLTAARLIVAERDDLNAEPTVEIAHEVLIDVWPALRDWVDEDREALREQRRLTTDAMDWDQRGRPANLLASAGRVASIEERCGAAYGPFSPLEHAFMTCSRAYNARRRNRSRILIVILTTAVVLLLAASLIAVRSRRDQATAAMQASAEAEAAENALDSLIKLIQLTDPMSPLITRRGDPASGFVESTIGDLDKFQGHPRLQATLLDAAGAVYQNLANYDRAEQMFHKALEIRESQFGGSSPESAASHRLLADLMLLRGQFDLAEKHAERSIEIRRKNFGEEDVLTAESLDSLGRIKRTVGEYDVAESLLQRAYAIQSKQRGATHEGTIQCANDLAALRLAQGSPNEAFELYKSVWEARSTTLTNGHPLAAVARSNLASALISLGKYTKAKAHLQEALENLLDSLQVDHPQVCVTRDWLATVDYALGQYQEAHDLFEQSLQSRINVLGVHHPETAISFQNVASSLLATGDVNTALSLQKQCVQMLQQTFRPEHTDTVTANRRLGEILYFKGDLEESIQLLESTLHLQRRNLEIALSGRSEHVQLRLVRDARAALDSYLSAARDANVEPSRLWQIWIEWKGVIYLRQLARRSLTDPDSRHALAELESIANRLSTLLTQQVVASPNELAMLSQRFDELHRKLGKAASRNGLLGVTPREVQRVLPPDTALIDFAQYNQLVRPEIPGGKPAYASHLMAFVVRHDGPIQCVRLGAAAEIDAAVNHLSRESASLTSRGVQDPSPETIREEAVEAGPNLNRWIWQPLHEHLGDARTILVSPDGTLSRLPLGALPDQGGQKFLLENYTFVRIPVPRLLPSLVSRINKGDSEKFLAIGDVDYDLVPSGDAEIEVVRGLDPPPPERRQFGRLPGTAAEVAAIRKAVESADPKVSFMTLKGKNATETAFLKQCRDARWVHLATHCYFAEDRSPRRSPDEPLPFSAHAPGVLLSGGVEIHPGLLSYLVLAGANRYAHEGDSDGILTAFELSMLDLTHVELAVLSACDTGTGQVAGGEGMMGLARAFQISGAKTTISSLWMVSDRASAILMTRLYENLWQRHMSKVEALREAQLWMLREGIHAEMFAGDAFDSYREKGRLPAYYWAGFVLSGDWR